MERRYLLATKICMYIRQNRSEQVLRRFHRLRPGEAPLLAITYGELLYGAAKNAQEAGTLERLHELAAAGAPLPETAAGTYGTNRAELETKGELIGNNELWIASHALASGVTLVTNNQNEFRRVRGLKIRNWVRSSMFSAGSGLVVGRSAFSGASLLPSCCGHAILNGSGIQPDRVAASSGTRIPNHDPAPKHRYFSFIRFTMVGIPSTHLHSYSGGFS